MAVQIARIECGRIKVDIDAIGKILDKVVDRLVGVIAFSGPLQSPTSSTINQLFCKLAAEGIGNENSVRQIDMTNVLWKNAGDQASEILMWPEPLMESHNERNIAVLLMTINGTEIVTFGCLLASIISHHTRKELTEDMIQILKMTMTSAEADSQQDDCSLYVKLLSFINQQQVAEGYISRYDLDISKSCVNSLMKDKLMGIMPNNRVVLQDILSSIPEAFCFLAPKFSGKMIEGDVSIQNFINMTLKKGRRINRAGQSTDRKLNDTEWMAILQQRANSLGISNIATIRTKMDDPGDVSILQALSVTLRLFKLEMTMALNGDVNLSHDQLCKIHASKKQEAVAIFKNLTVKEPQADRRWYVRRLQAEFDESLGKLLLMNHPLRSSRQTSNVQMEVSVTRQQRTSWKWFCFFLIGLMIVTTVFVMIWLLSVSQNI